MRPIKKFDNQIYTDAFAGFGKSKPPCNIVGISVQCANYFIAISLSYSGCEESNAGD